MKIQIEIIKRMTIITFEGKRLEKNTAWIKSLLLSDFIQLIKDGKL